jgi:hypothetical protein
VASLVFLALGLGYVLAGAVMSHRVIALGAVLLITGAIGYETGVLGIGGLRAVLPEWARLSTRLMLGAIWIVAIATTLARRGRHGDAEKDRTLRTVLLFVFCGLFGGYLLVLRLASLNVNGQNNFPRTIDLIMTDLSLLAVPILAVAATDFGEWGQLAGEHILAATGGARRLAGLVVPGLGCIGLLVIAWVLALGTPPHRLQLLGKGVLTFALAVVVLLIVGRILRLGRNTWSETLNFAGIFAVVAVVTWGIAGPVGLFSGFLKSTPTPEISEAGQFTAAANVRTLAGAGGFTVLLPAGWQSQVKSGNQTFSYLNPTLGSLALFVGRAKLGDATILSVAKGLGPPKGTVRQDGPRQRIDVEPPPPATTAVVWLEPVPGSPDAYLFQGVASGKDAAGMARQLDAVVNSFRLPGVAAATTPDASTTETPAAAAATSRDRVQTAVAAGQVLLTLIALFLVAGIGKRWPSRLRGALLLFGVYTLITLFARADAIGRVLLGPTTSVPHLGEVGLLAGVAVLGLVGLAASWGRTDRWARRLPAALTGLVGGVLALRLMETLFNKSRSASRVALWAAVIVLLAIAWDIAISGESMTNSASKHLPRTTRVLLFFGYSILLAATVIYFSAQRVAGSGVAVSEQYFEPDLYTQAALFRLALPLLLLLFLLRVFGAVHADEAPPTSTTIGGDPDLALEVDPAELLAVPVG